MSPSSSSSSTSSTSSSLSPPPHRLCEERGGGAQSPKSSGLCAAFSKIYNESHNKGRDRVDFPARTIPLENISPRAHKSNLTNGRNLKTLKIWDQTQLQQPTLWCRCPGFVRATAPYNCFSFSLFFSPKKTLLWSNCMYSLLSMKCCSRLICKGG